MASAASLFYVGKGQLYSLIILLFTHIFNICADIFSMASAASLFYVGKGHLSDSIVEDV